MNIQDLKSNTTWQEASNTINNNNNKISLAIATLENVRLKNKGYFTTLEKLNEAIPNPTIGSKAYVGTSEPYAIYIVENGVWVDSGYTGGDEIVANITTDRIEDGAVTSEKIATTAFDDTLSVIGKIAPADVVGKKLTELEMEVDTIDEYAFLHEAERITAEKYSNTRYYRIAHTIKAGATYIIEIDAKEEFITDIRYNSAASSSAVIESISDGANLNRGINKIIFTPSNETSSSFIYISNNGTLDDDNKINAIVVVELKSHIEEIKDAIKTNENSIIHLGVEISNIEGKTKEFKHEVEEILTGKKTEVYNVGSTLHTGWGKYLFLLPFDNKYVGLNIETKMFCRDIPNGTYTFYTYRDNYSTVLPTSVQVAFEDGYGTIPPITHIEGNATGWRIGTATMEGIKVDSHLSVINLKDGLIEKTDKAVILSEKISQDIGEKENVIEKYKPILHAGWGKYLFLLPFGKYVGMTKVTKVYCKDIPDGTYTFYAIKDSYSNTVIPTVDVEFVGGYGLIDARDKAFNNSAIAWRIGTATMDSIKENSELLLLEEINGVVASLNDFKNDVNTRHEYWGGADYYQKVWSTINCAPIMLKNHPWKKPIEWNLNICINSDAHLHAPDIYSRINRWNFCFDGNQDTISSQLCSSAYPERNEDYSQQAIAFWWSLGDTGTAQITIKEKVKKHWEYVWSSLDSIGNRQRPQLITIGNHDLAQDGNDIKEYFTRADRYNYIIKQMLMRYSSNHLSLDTEGKFSTWNKMPIITPNIEYPTMWMVDIEQEKVRVISLDAFDWDDSESSADGARSQNIGYFSTAQIDWLVSCLSSVPDGYAVFVGSHYFYTAITQYGGNGNIVKNILLAYKNKTTHTDAVYRVDNKTFVKNVSVDFSGNKNSEVLWIVGHDHNYKHHVFKDESIGRDVVNGLVTISTDAEGGIYRGIFRDMFDILCYNKEDGLRIARYGGVGTRFDCNRSDGGDENGFHFINNPLKL